MTYARTVHSGVSGAAPSAVYATPVTLVSGLFFVCYAATALDAYSVGPIPITWLAQTGLIAVAAVLVVGMNRIRVVPGTLILFGLIVWALVANALNVFRFPPVMPAAATLPYVPFVIARYLHVLSFAAAYYLTYWLLTHGRQQQIVEGIVGIGAVVALIALYVYAAQLLDLPQPPRTRYGTGVGGTHAELFTSGTGTLYYRAMGPFREPSHFAEWMLLPLFLSLTRPGRRARAVALLIGVAFLLSISLTGIFSAVIGVVLATLLLNPLRRRNVRILFAVMVAVALAAASARYIRIAVGGADETIFSMVEFRVLEIFESGVSGSSRGGVFRFVSDNPPPWHGLGMGNGNIYPAHVQNSDVMMSYLSLYLAIWYSAGLVGLILLLMFLVRPLARIVIGRGRDSMIAGLPSILAAYLAYLVAFAVLTEELTIHFGMVAGLLMYGTATSVQFRRHQRSTETLLTSEPARTGNALGR